MVKEIYRCKVSASIKFLEIERGEELYPGMILTKEQLDELVGYRDQKGCPVVEPEWFEKTSEEKEKARAEQKRAAEEARAARQKSLREKQASAKAPQRKVASSESEVAE